MARPHLSLAAFCNLVTAVLEALPDEFRRHLENVPVDVEDRPSPQLLAGLQHAGAPTDLLGIFLGQALPDQEFGVRYPNRIVLFQRSIERICRSEAEIAYEVRRTLLHELAHHFGYSEEDLDEFESQPSPFDR